MPNGQIICPNCDTPFKLDETSYDSIIKQVRDKHFTEELEQRLSSEKKTFDSELSRIKSELVSASDKQLTEKEIEIRELRAELSKSHMEQTARLEKQIGEMKQKLENADIAKDKAISDLKVDINQQHNSELSTLKDKLNELNNKLESADKDKELALTKALDATKDEKRELESKLEQKENEKLTLKDSLTENYQIALRNKEEQISQYKDEVERLKDFKLKLSTKMVGESLEQHCENEFNRLRPTAFPNVDFEKDNEISGGTKGDYVYREKDNSEIEVLSIMFEMKNENDATSTKKKNEDFFKTLDKNRTNKKCEYAVLVSLLESDSDLYNQGIVDVSYKYPKMFVVRPQFFILIISLLRQAAWKSMEYKTELAVVRNQNIDITKFEERVDDFRKGFARNYDLASRQFTTAIDEIDKSINHLEKTKKALISSENNLRLANQKTEALEIRSLTKDNPTMLKKFEDIE